MKFFLKIRQKQISPKNTSKFHLANVFWHNGIDMTYLNF